jgi:3-isopropylmalate dehydrogenase
MEARIVLLPGDGVGPEVIEQSRLVLDTIASRYGHRFRFETLPVGGAAIDAFGVPLPSATLDACRSAQAILLGAVGGPKWEGSDLRPEQGLLALRKELGLFANIRPVRAREVLLERSPVRAEIARGTDLVIVRELTGGLYFGERRLEIRDGRTRAIDTMVYGDDEITRISALAFRLARSRRRKVTSVDKANVLECSRLWRRTAEKVARDFPDVELAHGLVDSVAMQLIASPASFDVILTENLFGDVLSDEAAVLAGSLGMLPSASLSGGGPGLYEPVHGSAPDIAGSDRANPIGAIESAAMLLAWSLGLEVEARAIEAAIDRVLADGARTRDLGGTARTTEIGRAICASI